MTPAHQQTVLSSSLSTSATGSTSGTGGSLPRGIPVGEIVRLTEDGVEIGLYASDQGAHLVRVVDYAFPNPDEASEPEAEELPSAEGAVLSEAEEASADG